MGPYVNMSEYPMHICLIMISNEIHTDEPILPSVPLLVSDTGQDLTG